MARLSRLGKKASGLLTMVVVVALAVWLMPDGPISSAQDRPNGKPLIARGYTDAATGTVVVAGDPAGGQTVLELRIKDGQSVKKDEIIALLASYPQAETSVRIAEAGLAKLKQTRETMLTGPRVTQIAMAEADIQSTIESQKLQTLLRQRSGKPVDQKELEISIAERGLVNQKASLEQQKKALKTDLELNAIDIKNAEARVESARADVESAIVRSPVDGLVVEIYTRQGEMIPGHPGIAKIVDMRQLRVVAEVDELHLPRLVVGAPVEITFRGSPHVYKGKVVRAPMTVTRVKRSKADLGLGSAHSVEAEIEFDDPSSVPQMLEREARVVFL